MNEPSATIVNIVLKVTKKKLMAVKSHESNNISIVLFMFFSFLAFNIAATGFVKISFTLSNKTPNKY